MENENSYTNTLRKLSDEELNDYVDQPENYEQEAVIAAVWELQKRKIATEKAIAILAWLEEKRDKMLAEHLTIIQNQQAEQELPVLYSKGAIRFFSIFFSTLFGGILLSINLNRIQKNTEILYVLGFSFIYTYGIGVVVTFFPDYITFIALSMNLLGLIILERIFWKRIIGDNLKYQRRPIWLTLGVGLLIATLLLLMIMK